MTARDILMTHLQTEIAMKTIKLIVTRFFRLMAGKRPMPEPAKAFGSIPYRDRGWTDAKGGWHRWPDSETWPRCW